MMTALRNVLIYRYGVVLTALLTERFTNKEDPENYYGYMEGCNMALVVPNNKLNRASLPMGLLSDVANHGAVITWKKETSTV